MHRILPALDAPDCVLRLDAVTTAPSLCVLARNADASATSVRTHDTGHCARLPFLDYSGGNLGFMDTIKGWFGKAKGTAGDVADKAGDMAGDAMDKAKDVAGDIKDKFDGDDDKGEGGEGGS